MKTITPGSLFITLNIRKKLTAKYYRLPCYRGALPGHRHAQDAVRADLEVVLVFRYSCASKSFNLLTKRTGFSSCSPRLSTDWSKRIHAQSENFCSSLSF